MFQNTANRAPVIDRSEVENPLITRSILNSQTQTHSANQKKRSVGWNEVSYCSKTKDENELGEFAPGRDENLTPSSPVSPRSPRSPSVATYLKSMLYRKNNREIFETSYNNLRNSIYSPLSGATRTPAGTPIETPPVSRFTSRSQSERVQTSKLVLSKLNKFGKNRNFSWDSDKINYSSQAASNVDYKGMRALLDTILLTPLPKISNSSGVIDNLALSPRPHGVEAPAGLEHSNSKLIIATRFNTFIEIELLGLVHDHYSALKNAIAHKPLVEAAMSRLNSEESSIFCLSETEEGTKQGNYAVSS